MTRSATKPAAVYALIAVVLLSAYGFWVFVGSLHGPTRVEKVEMAVAFPALALADHLGVLPDSGFYFWLLALGGFVFWFVVLYRLAVVLLSRGSRVSDV
jgi:hypothetical protein